MESFILLLLIMIKIQNSIKKWISFHLNDKNKHMILVPPKFGNGHYVISEKAIFHYKQSTLYDRSSQFTINWKDPNYNIKWPCKNPIISKRDK